MKKDNKIIRVKDTVIGGEKPVLIAGPCSIESREHIIEEAKALKELGVDIIRGGAFKPRTSPLDFQGIGFRGVEYLKEAAETVNLPFVTEVLSEDDVDRMIDYVDIFQVGSRNMYNYALLKKIARTNKPVILKRGFSATIYEWQMAAKYLEEGGNDNIIFCERGIRTFETETRNTLDLAGAYIIKEKTGYPVIVDPSHGTGKRELIMPMTRATLALGLDGVMIEVHPNPDEAISDAAQTIGYDDYKKIADYVGKFHED
ncbi:3-deoxy-7-phosphoheptulonate synthase [Peptoniphilus sp.]|jgi:3-deoxy-7-phosphoheptulonate synthase|uniref:3-deoxy-7-phosphoheptulonate synthase n=1 Tax=Peptoniphilus sp. TaxID=1971214 RepID=UPI003D91C93A